jgi:tetratricopeptide (TPR) repeat protein
VLSAQGKLAEAETLHREALAIASKRLGNEHPDTAKSLDELVDVLLSERKFDEAEQPFNGLLTPAFQSDPKSAALLRRRGNLRARTGHWKEAAADFSKVVEFEPDNHEAYHSLAPLLVQSGDLEGYRRLCSKIAARFGGTSDPVIAERMAKDCLLFPPPGTNLTTESNWAETAVTIGKHHQYWAFFQFAEDLAEYRQGHFASAAEWMQKVLTQTGQVPFRDLEACMVLTMAQYRSGQMDQARATFAQGVAIAETKLAKLDSGDIGEDWGDWIIAHALMREAIGLIEGQADLLSNQSKGK